MPDSTWFIQSRAVYIYSPNFSHLCKSKFTGTMPFNLKQNIFNILKFLVPSALALYTLACATIVSPTGGPKDVTPPKLVVSEPKALSTNFQGNKLVLTFDEYIQLKSPEKFLLISPPLKKMPEINIRRGRDVVVKLEDTLLQNTTYNFYFGEAIVDLNESNPIPNFNFAFSTGNEIDSLSLSGSVTDAFTRLPAKGVFVGLYKDFSDSIPMKHIPVYVSRTTDNGNFHFNNLASGKYCAMALMDGNNDYMFNLPTEMVGFSSDSVQPYYNAINLNDTVAMKKADLKKENLVTMTIFPQPDSVQRVLKSVIAAKNKLSVVFRYPTTKPSFRALNIPDSLPWALQEWNHTNDTLNAWLLNKPDTLKLEIADRGVILDTIAISTEMKVVGKPRNPEKAPRLTFTSTAGNRVLGYNKPLVISFVNPVGEYDLNKIVCTRIAAKDTLTFKPEIKFTDTIRRHLLLAYNWNATDKYDVYIPKAAFTGIYRDTCDSTHIAFQVKKPEEYGKFTVLITRKDKSYPVIVQLLTDKGLVVDQRIITNEKSADFGLLPPGKYGLKAIMDANANGRWDTGIFIKKIQPEKVIMHPKLFEVRMNWEEEETWDL
ncbi:MAG TPA: Ig-like domain-containing protein [Bacteroidales bacterium]|nr:Ig-like domain-containing protein [Bacteroidales bacterium]